MKKKLFTTLALISIAFAAWAQHEGHTQQAEPAKQESPRKDDKREKRKQDVAKYVGKRVEYNLHVKDTLLPDVSTRIRALGVNGGLPAPTLYFTEGDTAIIRVHNLLKREETSIHWHGLLLPNEQDGVPYLTTAPIKAGKTHTFIFPLIQSGTYWYHSHTSVQEQIGTYGSIVIYPRNYDKQNEKVIMLSDWIHERPHYVLKSLKRASEWYSIRKNAVQSWGEALMQGYLKDRFKTEWQRMPAMDVSDVYYDKFLLNGRTVSEYPDVKPGESVRLRIINGAASSYFWLQFAGGEMRVVAADGLDVEPVEVDRLMIAIAETYDVEVTLPKDGMSYELRATSIDIVGHSSLYIGKGMKMKVPDMPKLDYFAMMREMNNMDHMGMDMSGKDVNEMDMKNMDHGNMKGMDHSNMKQEKAQKDSTMNHDHGAQPTKKNNSDKKDEHIGHEMETEKEQPQDTVMNHENMNMEHEGHQAENENQQQIDQKAKNENDKQQDQMQGMDHSNMQMDGMNDTIPNKTSQVVKEDTAIVERAVHDHESLAPGNKDEAGRGEVVFDYNMLRSPKRTTLDPNKPMREVPLTLTGNMIRYVWSFDNKVLSKSDKILIKQGENVRFILTNNTMMRHPLHLHGHFFRFVNKQGEYSPMKHTFDIQPMETVIIEFYANEEKDWFFHCHVLYHMMAGMARVVSYENSPPNEQVSERDKMKLFHEDKMWWLWGVTKIATDGVFGEINYSNNFNQIASTYRVSYQNQYEFQPDYSRFIDKRQFLSLYIGADIRNTLTIREVDQEEDRRVGVVGARYLLPLFIQSELRLDHKGQVRFQLSREDMPITRRLRLAWSVNTDKEYNIDFDYFVRKFLSIHASYDSEYKYGMGLTFLW